MDNSTLPHDHKQRLVRAYLSLDGLSIGDGLGSEMCWQAEGIPARLIPNCAMEMDRRYGNGPVNHVHIVAVRPIEQDELARSFAEHFDPGRMYGPAMYHELLPRLRNGEDWRCAAKELFHGGGSLGNGGQCGLLPWEPISPMICRALRRRRGFPRKSRTRIPRGSLERLA